MQRNDHELRNVFLASLTLLPGILISGCATSAKTGTFVGAAVGAAAGQWIGKDTEGTLIGAGVGAAAGYMIGNEKDKEKARQYDSSPPPD